MRRLPPWALASIVPLLWWTACDGGDAPRTRNVVGPAVAQAPTTRVVVLRLGDGVELLGQRTLPGGSVARRPGSRHWKGRWQVLSAQGRVLHRGRFRIPRRRHALFGEVGGPARAVDVALERPVVWLRVDWSASAQTLVVYDDHGRRRLGAVAP